MEKQGRNKSQCRHCNIFVESRQLEEHERHCRGHVFDEVSSINASGNGLSKTRQIKDLVRQHYGKSINIDYGMGEVQCKKMIKQVDLKLWVNARKLAESSRVQIQDSLLKVLSDMNLAG